MAGFSIRMICAVGHGYGRCQTQRLAARHPSPKKSPAPRMATTASLPCLDDDPILILPFWM